jgi:hypothetical protein
MNLSRVFCVSIVVLMVPQTMHGMRIVQGAKKVLSNIVEDVSDARLKRQLTNYHWNIVFEHKKILQRFPWYHDQLCSSCNKDAEIFFERQNMLRNAQEKEKKQWLQGLYAPDSGSLFRYTSAFETIQGRNGGPLFDGSLDPYMLAMMKGVMDNNKYPLSEKLKFIGPIFNESFQENKENNDGEAIYEFSKKVLELGIEADKLSCEKSLALAIKHNNVFTAEAIIKHLLSVMKERQEKWPERLLACSLVEIAVKENEEMAAVFFDCGVKRDNRYISNSWLHEQEDKAIIRAAKRIEVQQLSGMINNFCVN